jgi:hypothetical protein
VENIWTKEGRSNGRLEKVARLEHHNLYSSRNIIRQMKPRGVRWAGHVARIGEEIKVGGETRREETTGKTEA